MKQILLLFICSFFTIVINAQQNIVPSSAMFHAYIKPVKEGLKPYQMVKGIKWKFKTEGKIFSSAIIIKGLALVGSEDKNLYAINIHTGKQKTEIYHRCCCTFFTRSLWQ